MAHHNLQDCTDLTKLTRNKGAPITNLLVTGHQCINNTFQNMALKLLHGINARACVLLIAEVNHTLSK